MCPSSVGEAQVQWESHQNAGNVENFCQHTMSQVTGKFKSTGKKQTLSGLTIAAYGIGL